MLGVSLSCTAYISSLVVGYLLIVRTLRYRHRNVTLRRFPSRSTLSTMTLDEAYAIQSRLVETEFPMVFSSSVFFALFKTYGIPSISRLLAATGQLANSKTASKRAADTAVILTEVVLHHPTNPRAIEAIARMNFLHSKYRKAGRITDADMLYTLSLFILEPVRWATRFEWRSVTDAERCAIGMYWKHLGDAMEIPFDALCSSDKGWSDGLQFFEELEDWSRRYEETFMLPAETNRLVARGTIDIGLFNVPRVFHGVADELVSYLLDERLRRAMGFNSAAPLSIVVFDCIFSLRRFLLRHFFLPRPYFLRWRWFEDKPNKAGPYNVVQYIAHPWYVRPSWRNRWGLNALLLRLTGGAVPGDDDGEFCRDGYVISAVGPEKMRGQGEHEMRRMRKRLEEQAKFGCPFAMT